MSESQWMSELQQEGIEHSLPNDYLESVTPKVFNYGVEVELPRVSVAYMYLFSKTVLRKNVFLMSKEVRTT